MHVHLPFFHVIYQKPWPKEFDVPKPLVPSNYSGPLHTPTV